MMQFGVTLFPGATPAQMRQWARLAEEGGFDYIGVADTQSLAREVYVTLTLLALETKRALLGPTVTNPLTRHPAVTASAIASVNEVAGGRVFLGVGSGDSAILNLGLRPVKLAQMREYLTTMRALFSGETYSYEGRRIHTRWISSSVPLVLAAEGPKTLQLAGELADAALVHTGLTPEVLQDTVAQIRAGEKQANRPPGTVKVWAFAKCNVADTREEAIGEIKMALAASAHHSFRFTLEGKHLPPDLHEPIRKLMEQYVPAQHEQVGQTRNAALSDELGLTDYLAQRFAVVGTPQECRQQVQTIADQGVDVLFLTAIGPRPDEILRRLSQEVIAPLRA